jgi:1-acyl-sn-glycerol-3-phosphate acyltransferase
MGARKLRQNVNGFSRIERIVRSSVLGFPFVVVNAFTKWEIHGKENFFAALRERDTTGRGLITVSNHSSLFDDPLVMMGLLRLYHFTVETKCWWSTACASNFNPAGRTFKSKFVRYFSDVSNMIFLSRAKKRKDAPPTILDDPLEYLSARIGSEGMERLMALAERKGGDITGYLKGFYTKGPDGIRGRNAALNQIGMIETIAKANAGQWVHLFPEGTRSRNIHLRMPRAGVGKVIHHADNSIVLPLCFYGTQDILPVGAVLPRFFKRVVVNVGRPVPAGEFAELRRRAAGMDTYDALSRRVMSDIALLRPFVLERYLGAQQASRILLEEAQLAMALGAMGDAPARSDIFVEPYGQPAQAGSREGMVQEPSSSPMSGVGAAS